jgi:hypothetical protein
MSATRVLEVVIAAIFMFYVTALISSGLVEWLSNLMKKRAKYLLRGIRALLVSRTTAGSWELAEVVTGPGSANLERNLYRAALGSSPAKAEVAKLEGEDDLYQRVVEHPLVRSMAQSTPDNAITRFPSYVPARTFVTALLDGLHTKGAQVDGPPSIEQVRARVTAMADGELKEALTALLRNHGKDVESFTRALENWYDDQMDRLSGAYKRWAKRWLVVIGIVIAAVMHLDAIGLAKHLWTDEPARAAIVEAAEGADQCLDLKTADERGTCIDDAVTDLAGSGPPIGPQAWGDAPDDGWLFLLLGIGLTGAAASLGAPFWFDALGRLNSLRNSGPKPPKAEGSA